MGDDAWPLLPIAISEAALIGVNPVPVPKVIKITDDPVAGAGPEEVRSARGKAALDQQSVEGLEEPARERMFPAAPLPGCAMQNLQLRKKASASAVVAAVLSCSGP